MKVNIALLTVTDTRTFDNDKSGAILVDKIKEANHNLLDRKICKDEKDEIINDLIVAAYNDAKGKLKKKTSEEILKVTGIPNLPFDFKIPF